MYEHNQNFVPLHDDSIREITPLSSNAVEIITSELGSELSRNDDRFVAVSSPPVHNIENSSE